MVWEAIPSSPFVIYLAALAVGYGIYAWSRTIAPVAAVTANKVMQYVGGEPVAAQSYQPGYQFYYVALFFTLVHVGALVIATATPASPLWATIGYLVIIVIAVVVLRWEQ
jgi:NADH:ubiquinone oxidoreductase subunit 3 (subunit A)